MGFLDRPNRRINKDHERLIENNFCYLQDFVEWRDPYPNRGHHDFQLG